MNEDEALFEARREIAQLRRKIEKLKIQNESLRESSKHDLNIHQAWAMYYDMWRKCNRQRDVILQIQASPRGSKHWFPEYMIEEQESLEEALNG